MTDLADWALEKAIAAARAEGNLVTYCADKIKRSPGLYPAIRALARYIADHEEPPVDPLLIEAREVVAQLVAVKYHDGAVNAERVRKGHWDTTTEVQSVLLGLKRGKEMWS